MENCTPMEHTYFPNVFFANLHYNLAIIFIYYRHKPIFFMHLMNVMAVITSSRVQGLLKLKVDN
jgi:hypothetical protein